MKGISSADACKKCRTGKYSDEQGNSRSDRCKNCERGMYGDEEGLTKLIDCSLCPIGTYSEILAITEISDCKNCPIGRWSNATAVDERDGCDLCGRGRYANETGGTRELIDCIKCPKGRASNLKGASSLDACVACPPGRWMGLDSLTTECLSCPKGWSQPMTAKSFCSICPIAKYAKFDGSSICQECRAGTIGIEIGATSCELCTEGRYQEDEEKTECVDCEIGKFNNCQGSGFCFFCEKGTTTYEQGSTICVVKRVKTKPAVILDNMTFVANSIQYQPNLAKRNLIETNEKNSTALTTKSVPLRMDLLCITWLLPESEKGTFLMNQELEWSPNRLFLPSMTNTTIVSNTTTNICLTMNGDIDLFVQVIYVRITPTVDDAKGTPSNPSSLWATTPSCDDESYLDDNSTLVQKWRCKFIYKAISNLYYITTLILKPISI